MSYPFVEAKWKTVTSGRDLDLIVVHTIESDEKPTTAEAIADWFRRGPKKPDGTPNKVSSHGVCDNNSTIRCVRDKDVAYAAPGANHNGLHIEHAGRARQTPAEWADPYSVAMLRDQSAVLAAHWSREKNIPVRWVSVADLRTGNGRGITSHHNVSLAFGKSTHTDPGPHFPIDPYLGWVSDALHPAPPTPPLPPTWSYEEDDVKTTLLSMTLGSQGEGYTGTGDLGLGPDPIPVGEPVINAPWPPSEGYGKNLDAVRFKCQARGNEVIVVASSGPPNTAVSFWVSAAPRLP